MAKYIVSVSLDFLIKKKFTASFLGSKNTYRYRNKLNKISFQISHEMQRFATCLIPMPPLAFYGLEDCYFFLPICVLKITL